MKKLISFLTIGLIFLGSSLGCKKEQKINYPEVFGEKINGKSYIFSIREEGYKLRGFLSVYTDKLKKNYISEIGPGDSVKLTEYTECITFFRGENSASDKIIKRYEKDLIAKLKKDKAESFWFQEGCEYIWSFDEQNPESEIWFTKKGSSNFPYNIKIKKCTFCTTTQSQKHQAELEEYLKIIQEEKQKTLKN